MAAALVKTEEGVEITQAHVPSVLHSKAEEEEVDYGGPEENANTSKAEGPPLRAMPDYGDIVDADDDAHAGGAKEAKKEEGASRGPSGPPRRDAIHVSGVVQRLTRNHLAEIFEAKQLPVFRWVEWIEDDQVVCVFEDEKDAAAALRGCEAGFADTFSEDSRPGAGLWRAQRAMLDFRLASQGDAPAADFKKKHRCGQQVREFRFWEAIKDADKSILGREGVKRAAPSGEDAFAAAEFDDDARRRKRLRRGPRPGEEEDEIELLKRMAQQDKSILTKDEDDVTVTLPKSNDASLVIDDVFAEQDMNKEDRWSKRAWGGRDDAWGGGWQDDGDDWWSSRGRQNWWDDGQNWNPRKRRRGANNGSTGGGGEEQPAAKADDGGQGRRRSDRRGPGGEGFALPMDDAEEARRSKRAARFRSG